jgi:hypothetical protein
MIEITDYENSRLMNKELDEYKNYNLIGTIMACITNHYIENCTMGASILRSDPSVRY